MGCGGGLFFELLSSAIVGDSPGQVVGIVPTQEEAATLGEKAFSQGVEVLVGRAEKLPEALKDADFIFCNSVFLGGGFSVELVTVSLREFRRKILSGGLVFVGETPDCLEIGQKGSNFFQDISGLFQSARSRCWRRLAERSLKFAKGLVSCTVEITTRAPGFAMSSAEFVELAERSGFEFLEMNHSGSGVRLEPKIQAYDVRLDYLFRAP